MDTFAKPVADLSAGCPPPPTVAGADRPLRADARRNRDRVLQAAREIFGSMGRDASMEDISHRAGVGVGTIYRQFPTKNALLTELVRTRFVEMTDLAREVERADASAGALAATIRRQTDAVADDKGFQLGVLGWEALDAARIDPEIAQLAAVTQRLIDRAAAAGLVRDDLTPDDIGMMMCGVTAIMHFKPHHDWHRHLEFLINGFRP